MQKNELKATAEKLVEVIRERYLDQGNLLILGMGHNGEVLSQNILDDFGDVAPFIALYGGEDICEHHIKYIIANHSKLGFVRAFAYTDLVLGLIWYSHIGEYKNSARDAVDLLVRDLYESWFRNNDIHSMKLFGFPMPIINGIDSTFVEVWTELFTLTAEKKFLDSAKRTAEIFSSIGNSHTSGLIPSHFPNSLITQPLRYLLPQKFNKVEIMKDNTNFCFGLLDLFRVTQDLTYKIKFDEIYSKIESLAAQDNLKNEHNNNLTVRKVGSTLLPSFAFIDISCDAYKLFGEKRYIENATALADTLLKRQSRQTGLLPMNLESSDSYLDSETDMAVALLKLHECTSVAKYKEAAIRIVEGVIKFHSIPEGLALKVDVENGTVTNRSVKTKFVALFIKVLHLLIHDDQSIYKDSTLFMLAKDR